MMRAMQRVWSVILLSTTSLLIVGLIWVTTAYQTQISDFILQYPVFAPVLLVLWRILGIVIPPIPGGAVSLALIPVLGWLPSYIYAVIGVTVGSSIAFWLARWWREPLVARFVPLQQLHAWQQALSEKQALWSFIGIRFATGPILDFVSYAAGLTRLPYRTFLVATLLSELPQMATFYFGEAVYRYFSQRGTIVAAGVFGLLMVGQLLLKDRAVLGGYKKESDPKPKEPDA
jgi:uncharacterized membrane protein YdjX (TVP38/TMEM64 family)